MQPGSYFPFSFLSDHWRPLRPVQKKKKYQNEAAAAEQPKLFLHLLLCASFVRLEWRCFVGVLWCVSIALSKRRRRRRSRETSRLQVFPQPDLVLPVNLKEDLFFFCSLYSHFPSLFLPFSFNGSVFTLLLLFNGPLFCCLLFCWPFNSCRNF